MATDSKTAMATPMPQASHRGAPAPVTPNSAMSPPSKRELASWWKKFRKNNEKQEEKVITPSGIFGVPLAESIRYANVAISLSNDQGESFIYGYVPIVVAKCGVFLKDKATDVEGIFRLSGSAKRIKDLQTIFNAPDRYGKGLDWTGYTVHDAANVLRRYLNQLPEPIIPLEFYDRFRDPIRSHEAQAVGDMEAQATDIGNFDHQAAVLSYQKLITELPPLNRQLLLYILDLLAVFSSKSDLNRMNSANLAAIFQPGIISHPSHDMSPMEYRLSQDVLIFLIENQDNFLIGMNGTAVDEKTVKDVESGPPVLTPSKSNIGRSASNASGGADSLRKYGVRRNVSTSSRNSRDTGSNGVPSPLTPGAGGPFASGSSAGTLTRSNTVPTKRSPAISSARFQRPGDALSANPEAASFTPIPSPGPEEAPAPIPSTDGPASSIIPPSTAVASVPAAESSIVAEDAAPETENNIPIPANSPPIQSQTHERKLSSLFLPRSPVVGPSDAQSKEQRPTNRLRKKQRIPGSANDSAQSSQASLHGESIAPGRSPLASPELATAGVADPIATINPTVTSTAPTPIPESAPTFRQASPNRTSEIHADSNGLKPPKSPEGSLRSRSSATDASDLDALDDPATRAERAEKRRHRWHRFSLSAKKNGESPLAPPPAIGQNSGARLSNSSVGSFSRPGKSLTGDSQATQQLGADGSSVGYSSVMALSSQDSSELLKDSAGETEKKGLFGRWKSKIDNLRDDKKDRDTEKDRGKSPSRGNVDQTNGRHSLSVFAHEHLGHRSRSMDMSRNEVFAAPEHHSEHRKDASSPNFPAQQPQSLVPTQNIEQSTPTVVQVSDEQPIATESAKKEEL